MKKQHLQLYVLHYSTLDSNKAKQKAEWRSLSVLLLIPTVCCQDVTVPVRDKVAIILPPLSFPLLTPKLWHQPVLRRDPMSLCYTCPGEQNQPTGEGGGATLRRLDSDWPLCICGLTQVCLCGCSQTFFLFFLQGVWVRYLSGVGGKCVTVCHRTQ